MIFSNANRFYFLLSAPKEYSLNRNNKEELIEVFSSIAIVKTLLAIVGYAILILTITFILSFKDKILFTILYYIPITTSILIQEYLFRRIGKMKVITNIFIFIFVKSTNDYFIILILIFLNNIIALVRIYK